jgi:glycosyltransferase WbpL
MADWLLLILVLAASTILTGAVRSYAVKRSLIDVPNARSSHDVPTPRGGGLGLAAAFLLGVLGLFYSDRVPTDLFIALSGSGLLIAGIGYWDDHNHIPAQWRILVHLTAAAWVVAWLGGLGPIPFGSHLLTLGWVGDAAAIFFLTWLLNLFNFMDGIDGIAASEAVFAASSAAGLLLLVDSSQALEALWLVLLGASAMGFLLWNWPPAKIFMGDVGSGFLGMMLGVFMLYTSMHAGLNIWAWLILLGLFIVDATWTLLRRMTSGECWYEAHCSHAYQRLARQWQSHKKVTLAAWLVNLLWLLPLALIAALRPQNGALCLAVAYLPLLILAYRLGAGQAGR